RAKGPCLDELEVDPLVQGGEVRRASAQDDRTDEEPVLIDEAQLDEGGGQPGAADGQVLARLLPQLGDLFGNAVPDQPGVALVLRPPVDLALRPSDEAVQRHPHRVDDPALLHHCAPPAAARSRSSTSLPPLRRATTSRDPSLLRRSVARLT